jgi:glutathione S-transferase
LHDIGVPFAHVPVIQAYRLPEAGAADAALNTASPAFLAINPMGQIPALVDGDLVLTESLAITMHIARTLGGDLGPRDAAETALMEQWSLFAASNIEVPALEITYTYGNGTADTAEGRAIIAIAAEKLRRPFRRLDDHLRPQGQIIGSRFTVADINLAECVRYAQAHPTLLDEFPSVKDWLLRCQARPAFQKMWAARMAEPA